MLTIDNERCIQCGDCLAECWKEALSVNDDDQVVFDPEKCIWCGHCLAVCPRDCIVIDGDGYDCMEVEDLGFSSKPTAVQVRNMIMVRRSVRRFTDVEVTEDEINKILEAGKYAPTHVNAQGNAFIVVKSEEKRRELVEDTAAALEQKAAGITDTDPLRAGLYKSACEKFRADGTEQIFYNAPVIIFVFSDDNIDGSIAATTMSFMAQSMQLGVCMARIPIGLFDNSEMREKWQAPEGKKCVMALLIGNPEPEYFSSVPRKTPPVVCF